MRPQVGEHCVKDTKEEEEPQSRPRTTFSSKLPKHNFTRIWNKTGSTLAHGKKRLTFKRLLKNSYLEAYRSQIQMFQPQVH